MHFELLQKPIRVVLFFSFQKAFSLESIFRKNFGFSLSEEINRNNRHCFACVMQIHREMQAVGVGEKQPIRIAQTVAERVGTKFGNVASLRHFIAAVRANFGLSFAGPAGYYCNGTFRTHVSLTIGQLTSTYQKWKSTFVSQNFLGNYSLIKHCYLPINYYVLFH